MQEPELSVGPHIFPFTALVGQDRMKAALLANAVDPGIGGLLIRGEKGTGKTTIVRALAELLPPREEKPTNHGTGKQAVSGPGSTNPTADKRAHQRIGATGKASARDDHLPLVELPLNATEERVAGSINLEETLRTGVRHFEPGLLASANGGILYIDEVNLLEDHLVDLILDAAATGIHRVEREGFSLVHEAAFFLIGTMNPEEGELRPQFIDRFGLCVSIKGITDPEERKEIARRRIAFESDHDLFIKKFEESREDLRLRIKKARELLPCLELDDELWDMIVTLATRAGVQGHRADIVIAKTSMAFAALNGRVKVCSEDIREAARLALPHRISGAVDDTPESNEEQIDRLIGGASMAISGKEAEGQESGDTGDSEVMQVPGSAAAGSIVFDFLKKKSPP